MDSFSLGPAAMFRKPSGELDMKNFFRMAALAAAATIAATPAFAQVGVTPGSEPVGRARIIKPLTLTAVSDMDFGDITVWDAGVATMDTSGSVSCTATNLVCTGVTTAAEYTVTGTNNQTVQITKPDVTLTNLSDPLATLTLVLQGHGPDTLPLGNSGSTGTNFTLGGEIAIAASTSAGIYEGDLAVTVEY